MKEERIEFGLVLTQFSSRWDHVVSDARLAEEGGLDSLWLVDHLLMTRDPRSDILEGWTSLSAVAAMTKRVRIGHLVLSASFRNPGLLGKMASTLDVVSNGRLDLGLGAGWHEPEYLAFGYRFLSAGERRRYLEEYVDALRQLFEGGPVDFHGEYIDFKAAYCRPRPVQEGGPPIVVGASQPLMLNFVGRKADVWNCPSAALPRFDELRGQVLDAAGDRSVRTTIQVPVAVGRDRNEAKAALEVGRSHMDWMGDIEAIGITGVLDEAVEKAIAYSDRGVDGIIAVLPGSKGRPDFVEAYAELARIVRAS